MQARLSEGSVHISGRLHIFPGMLRVNWIKKKLNTNYYNLPTLLAYVYKRKIWINKVLKSNFGQPISALFEQIC